MGGDRFWDPRSTSSLAFAFSHFTTCLSREYLLSGKQYQQFAVILRFSRDPENLAQLFGNNWTTVHPCPPCSITGCESSLGPPTYITTSGGKDTEELNFMNLLGAR